MESKAANGDHHNQVMAEDVIAGRYRLLEPLGRGAMSAVWLAFDTELERHVALKTLAPTADRARFRREARAVAALSHPNICALYDYGESEGKPYMVLEYLPGGSLEGQLAGHAPLPDDETQRIASGIAAGLAHAHERALVHRDLKPSNVLFDAEGRPKIADFGIARMGGEGTLTEAGTVLGTAAYISPEQAAGLPATAASDVYSFGVILFRMLTGRLPFVADNAMELVRLNRDVPAPPVASLRPDAPAQLARTADAALAKEPHSRPADGAALAAAVAGVTAPAAPPPRQAPVEDATQVLPRSRPRRRSGLLLLALALGLAMLGGGAALALVLTDRGSSGNPGTTVPSLSVPSVPTTGAGSSTTTTGSSTSTESSLPSTTEATTTSPATTARTTTAHTTTARTTSPTTTAPPPTTTPPTTTFATTTVDTTTVTTAGTTTAAETVGTTTAP